MRLLHAAAIGLIAAVAVSVAVARAPDARLREFRGAYPEAAHPNGVVRERTLTAAPADVTFPDGRRLAVWAYDGTVPGPVLRVHLGDTLRVRFTNRLPQPTTIHWHGVRVPNAMDGVPGVTQAPIEPGESFVYEFTPKDAGTFWFHPHIRSSEQVERGLFGVLIVDDAEPPGFTRDETWVLDDLLLAPDGQIAPAFNTPHDLAHDGRWGNVALVNGKRKPTLEVRPGERLRLRLLDVANGRVFAPSFGELAPQIVAVDGLYTKRPVPLDGFEIAPGNRVDLDLVIPRDAAGRRFVIEDRFTRQPYPLAEIAVTGDPVETPEAAAPARAELPFSEAAAHAAPARADFHLNARRGGPFGIEWTINDEAMDHAHHG